MQEREVRMEGRRRPIYVTQPYLPPLEELAPYLEEIWARKVLTNGGPLHQALEQALCVYLGVPYVSLFNNATSALLVAVKALGLKGEVITTPYSFVATAHALMWCGVEPVFVDVDAGTLNLDPARVEEAVTPRTTGILPVHCYGRPCDVEAIGAVAARRGLRVLYDGAHGFGVRYLGRSLLAFGDMSVVSFHATKVMNTFEGGAVISHTAEAKAKVDRLRNFGFAGEVALGEVGLNGKMSELNAAIGLLQLKHLEGALEARGRVAARYRALLRGVEGVSCEPIGLDYVDNDSYFPIMIGPSYPHDRDTLHQRLKDNQVFARRYFYPLISAFEAYNRLPSARPDRLPVATAAADAVLCLPIYPGLSDEDIDFIANMIRGEG
jgi:dTDP-4-amino-4,6-dideoxygalactose transaminase